MSVQYVGCSAATQLPFHSRLRATFSESVVGYLSEVPTVDLARQTFNAIQEGAPTKGVGYVATQYESGPDASAFTLDIITPSAGTELTAGMVAGGLDSLAYGFNLDRLQLVSTPAQPAQETAAQGATNRETATSQVQGQTIAAQASGFVDRLVSGAQGLGTWVLVALALVALIAVAYVIK